MGHDVEISFDGELSAIKSKLDELTEHVKGFGEKAKRIGELAFAAFGVHEVSGAIHEFIHAATEAAQTNAKLAAANDASGHAAGFTTEELKKQAKALEDVTLFGAGAVKGAQTIITTFSEIRGDEFQRVTKVALDMATILGGDATSAASELGKSLNDPIRGMMLLQRQGILLTQAEQERIKKLTESNHVSEAQSILLDKLEGKYHGAAEAAAGAAGGGFAQLEHIIHHLHVALGEGLLAVLDPLIPLFKKGADAVTGWAESLAEMGPEISKFVENGLKWISDEFNFMLDVGSAVLDELSGLWQTVFGETATQSVGRVFDFVTQVFTAIRDFAIDVFSAIEVGWNNIGDTADFVWTSIKLGAVTMFEEDKHLLTVQLPAVLGWFFDNWKEIFTDIYNLTTTIFKNIWENISNIFSAIVNWDFSGFEWTPLTKGFESAIKELPQIAAREMSPLEKELSKHLADVGGPLADKFNKQVKDNRAALGLDQPEGFQAAPIDPNSVVKKGKTGAPGAPDRARADRSGEEKATFEDLGALFKRIQSAAAGGSPELKEAKKTADATSETKEHTKASKDHLATAVGHLEKIANNTASGGGVPRLGK